MSYYDTLGVNKTATEAEIKSAFRRLAAKHHPDKGGNEEEFKKILEAYNTLKDKDTRRLYDQQGSSPFGRTNRQQTNSWGPFGNSFHFNDRDFDGQGFPEDIGDFFRSFTQGHRQQRPQQEKRNRDVRVTLNVPLKDTLDLQSKTINVKTDDGLVETLYVTIPRGARTGTRIKYPGLGDNMFTSLPRGDLYVDLVIDEHPNFSYNNTDLYTVLEISPFDAMIGGETEITGLDGKRFSMVIQPGMQPGTKMRIKGQGLYHQGSDVRGHLYVTVSIKIPTHLTDQQKQLVEELKELLEPVVDTNDFAWKAKHRKTLEAYLNTLATKDTE